MFMVLQPAWQAEKKVSLPSSEQAGANRLASQLQSWLQGVIGIPKSTESLPAFSNAV